MSLAITLIIYSSVLQTSSGTTSRKSQHRLSTSPVKAEAKDDVRPQKKRRTSEPRSKEGNVTPSSPSKPGAQLGSLIGRKRKEKKSKKGKPSNA